MTLDHAEGPPPEPLTPVIQTMLQRHMHENIEKGIYSFYNRSIDTFLNDVEETVQQMQGSSLPPPNWVVRGRARGDKAIGAEMPLAIFTEPPNKIEKETKFTLVKVNPTTGEIVKGSAVIFAYQAEGQDIRFTSSTIPNSPRLTDNQKELLKTHFEEQEKNGWKPLGHWW